jgi:D-serine dehydratase
VLLAPHGKTTMAPQIFAQQLAAGAWGITVATVQQLAICVRYGVRRVIMANQLLGDTEITAVVALQDAHRDLEFTFSSIPRRSSRRSKRRSRTTHRHAS